MRTYLKFIAGICLILFGIFSCTHKENNFEVVDLTSNSDGRLLHLKELMPDIQLVRLETSKQALVPQRYMTFIGEKYILILSDQSILQFDNHGKFHRLLAKRGKGPGEFKGIFSYDVNDDETEVYIHHWSDGKRILGYDLVTGTALPVINLPNWDLSSFVIEKDHVLVACGRSSKWELFTISYGGELIDTLPNLNPKSYGSYAGRGKYLKRLDGEIFYMNELYDTLYQIDGVEKSVLAYFKVDNPYDFETNTNGNLFQISNQLDKIFKLTLMEMHTEKTDGGVSTRIENRSTYLWDKKSKDVEYISTFYHDFFDLNVEGFSLENQGNVIYLEYSALDFLDMLSKSLDNKDLSLKKITQFKELAAAISEDDNPIYFVSVQR